MPVPTSQGSVAVTVPLAASTARSACALALVTHTGVPAGLTASAIGMPGLGEDAGGDGAAEVASDAGTGAAHTSSMRDQTRRNGRRIARPSLRLKKPPRSPRSAIGTTGTGVRATMRSTPGRKGASSPVSGMRPSGKMQTSSPASSARATSSKACSTSASTKLTWLQTRTAAPVSGRCSSPVCRTRYTAYARGAR